MRKAVPKNSSVMPMKKGRYGSIAVRLPTHEPPMPSASRTSGPTQHTDAPMAASTLAINELFSVSRAMSFSLNLFAQLLL